MEDSMKKSTKTTNKVTVSTYKDKPVISLPIKGTDKNFTFGPAKANAILNNMGDIIAFVQAKPTNKAKTAKYKGRPVLHLAKEGRPFSFGLEKAKAIKEHANAVIDFACSK
jgi:hypothetical protein